MAENKYSEPNLPEKRLAGCPECDRLWEVYALATRKHLDALLTKKAVGQTGHIPTMKALEDDVIEAAQWFALARKAIRDHAATHAGEKPEPPE